MLIRHLRKVSRTTLLAFALVLTPLVCQAKIYLLSVGISDYPGTKNDLRLPHNDAATMQWLYKQNSQAKVCLLMNDKAKVATVKKALQKMVSLATEDDIVVMFFSGHGVKGGFVCYDGFLYYSDIYSAMGACKSRNKMIFADACFSGAMRQENSSSPNGNNHKNSNVMLFLSCRSNEKSIETPKMTRLLHIRLATWTAWRCRHQQRPHHHGERALRLCECKGEKGIRQPPASRDVGQVLRQYAGDEVVNHICNNV